MKSLSVRLGLLMAVGLFGIVSAVAWWGARHETEMLHEEEIEQAETLAATMAHSLNVLIVHGDGHLVRGWLEHAREAKGIEIIRVLRRDGSIAFRDTRTIEQVNRYLGESRFQRTPLPAAQAAPEDREKAHQAVIENRRIVERRPGHLRLFIPIPAKQACSRCHGYDPHPVRGILQLGLSTKNAETRISEMRTLLWEMATTVSLLLGVILWAGLKRLVIDPVEQLRLALTHAGAGDHTHRLAWERQDELGDLAAGFNAMQEKLRDRNAMIHAIVTHAPNAMIVANSNGKIRAFNPAAERLFGYTEAEAMGRNVRILMPEPYRHEHDGYIRRYLETGEPHIIGMRGRELTAQKKDGSTFPIELLVADISLDGRPHFLAIIYDITIRKQHEETLTYMSLHDGLTRLPNRHALAKRMSALITEKTSFAVFYLGLNRFRAINEVLGHAAGDRVLITVGKRIKALCGETGMAARIGGDMFAVLWPEIDAVEDIDRIALRLLGCMAKPLQLHGYCVDVDARLGIATFPAHGRKVEELLRRAEIAMHAAKQLQRNHVCYDSEMERYQAEHLTLASELRHAIAAGELLLHYQPKVDMRRRQLTGVEALVRWQHPEKGFMPPDLFIPMAEETGLIHDFTQWLMETAIQQAAHWHGQGLAFSTAINLAARNLSEADLPERLSKALRHHSLPPDRLVLEITETDMMADPERAHDMLCRIHDIGIALSIDDFGTGYSSLAYLKDLPVDELKVDQSFVHAMKHEESSSMIVNTTIQLAHNLGLTVTAEGVEDEDTWQQLAAMDCDRVQGFFISRPMPVDEFERWLAESPWSTDNT